MSYLYLTEEDQQRIIAEVQASVPSVEALLRAQEAAHFKAVVGAKFGLNDEPDPLDVEAVKATPDGVKAVAADAVAERVHDELGVPKPVKLDAIVEAEVVR